MKRFAAVCGLTVLVAGCQARSVTGPSTSQPPPAGVTFTLSGTVTDGLGVAVEGARVDAVGQYDCTDIPPYPGDGDLPPCVVDQVLGSDVTDASGSFAIANLPAIYIRVDVQTDGMTVSQGVNLQQDSTVTLILP